MYMIMYVYDNVCTNTIVLRLHMCIFNCIYSVLEGWLIVVSNATTCGQRPIPQYEAFGRSVTINIYLRMYMCICIYIYTYTYACK